MKKRVLIAGLFHETHTFLGGTTNISDFQILRGAEMLRCEGDSSPLGGVLACAREFGWEVLPTADYRAQPSATVDNEVFEAFWADVLQQSRNVLECGGRNTAFEGQTSVASPLVPSKAVSPPLQGSATALQNAIAPIDAVYLVLHGAMVTTTCLDVEGELLRRLREIPAFAKVPIFGVFDLHANFSGPMTWYADCLVGYRENPHTDAREAACTSAHLLDRFFHSDTPLVQFRVVPDIIWPPTGTATANDPMKTLSQMARDLENEHPEIWSVSIIAGFSFADTFDTGVSILLVHSQFLKDDPISLLSPMMAYLNAHRHLGNVTDPPLAEVMSNLPSFKEGLTVLVEPSDNIGGGAPGDGTGLLRALLEHDISNSAICIADPVAVKTAEAAGIGSRVSLSIGGKGSRLDAGPVELEVEVVSLKDGRFELEDKNSHLASMCGDTFDMGRCAVVRRRVRQNAESPHSGECAYITILLTSIKTPPFDLGQWRSQGIEPTQLSVICVKAAVAHRRAYDPIATRMLWVDTPGPCSSNLKTLPYQHIRRPIYPLDS